MYVATNIMAASLKMRKYDLLVIFKFVVCKKEENSFDKKNKVVNNIKQYRINAIALWNNWIYFSSHGHRFLKFLNLTR